jgi:hypothetical protein
MARPLPFSWLMLLCGTVGGCGSSASSPAGPTGQTPTSQTFDVTPACLATQAIHVIDDARLGQQSVDNVVLQQIPPSQLVGITTLHTSTWQDDVSGHLFDTLAPEDAAQWQAAVGSRADFQTIYRSWILAPSNLKESAFVEAILSGDTKTAVQFALMAAEFWSPPCWPTSTGPSQPLPIGGEIFCGMTNPVIGYGYFVFVVYSPLGTLPGRVNNVFALQYGPFTGPYIPKNNGDQFEVQMIGSAPTIVTALKVYSVSKGDFVNFQSVTPFHLPSLFVQRLLSAEFNFQ